MKFVMVLGVALSFLAVGIYDVFKEKRKTVALDEIVRFVSFIKGELRYRTSDFETLVDSAKKQKYQYIKFDGLKILPDDFCDETVKSEFFQFINRIGTTDADGQISLCDEYISRFSEMLTQRKQKEKSKIQVNTALSVLSALCVIILSL